MPKQSPGATREDCGEPDCPSCAYEREARITRGVLALDRLFIETKEPTTEDIVRAVLEGTGARV